MPSRFASLGFAALLSPVLALGDVAQTGCTSTEPTSAVEPIPLVVVTDLYHPYQDVGDNLDLLTPFGLPDVELRAVVLDVTDEYLKPVAFPDEPGFTDPTGPRAPGTIPVAQLDAIFGRSVPYAAAIGTPMRSASDTLLDAPSGQAGIELLLRTLRESPRKVTIVSTGSARPIAVALNRDPALFAAKVERIHVVAGSSDPSFVEWNVHLDPVAMAALLRSPLPLALYPCATRDGAFAMAEGNAHWSAPDLTSYYADDPAPIQSYVYFALTRSTRTDYLAAMEQAPPAGELATALKRPLEVWETAAWLHATHRVVVARAGSWEVVRAADVRSTDAVLADELRPVLLAVHDDGTFVATPDADGAGHVLLYTRPDPVGQQEAFRVAVPKWYRTFAERLR